MELPFNINRQPAYYTYVSTSNGNTLTNEERSREAKNTTYSSEGQVNSTSLINERGVERGMDLASYSIPLYSSTHFSRTTPSVFIRGRNCEGTIGDSNGQRAVIYDLPTQDYNCSCFGIYGWRISREQVVQHLLSAAANPLIRELVAHDILSFILSGEEFPTQLEVYRGDELRGLAETYSEERRQSILEQLQDVDIFTDYVRYYIGGHVHDNPEGPYTMLSYERTGSRGVLAAIAELNGVSLRIYQRSSSSNRPILEEVFYYECSKQKAETVSLLHVGTDPEAPARLNHFNLLVFSPLTQKPPQAQSSEIVASLEDKQVLEYAREDFRRLSQLSISLEDWKKILVLKLKTIHFKNGSQQDRELMSKLLEAYFQRKVQATIKLSIGSLQEAFWDAIEDIIDQRLRKISLEELDNNQWKQKKKKDSFNILNMNSTDLAIQKFLEKWSDSFKDDWRKFRSTVRENKYKDWESLYSYKSLNSVNVLFFATEHCLTKVLRLLLAKMPTEYHNNGFINIQSSENDITALGVAVIKEDIKSIKALLKLKARTNTTDQQGDCVLIYAIESKVKEVVKILLEAGANPNFVNSRRGYAPLGFAMHHPTHDNEIIKLLLEYGASPDSGAGDGTTALSHAIVDGREDIVKLLLQAGADPNKKAQEGYPVTYALANKHYEILNFLLIYGANIEPFLEGFEGSFKSRMNKAELLNLLSNSNTDLQLSDIPYTFFLLEIRDFEALKILLNYNAELNFVFNDEHTPLSHACIMDSECSAVKRTFKGKIDSTPLFTSNPGDISRTQFLLEHGADPNLYGKKLKHLPLVTAILENNEEMIKLLLKYGANIHTKTPKGLSALKVASQKGREHIKQLLMDFEKAKSELAFLDQDRINLDLPTNDIQISNIQQAHPIEITAEEERVEQALENVIVNSEPMDEVGEDSQEIDEAIFELEFELQALKFLWSQKETNQQRKNKGAARSAAASSLSTNEPGSFNSIPEEKLYGTALKIRRLLEDILIHQPDKKLHKNDVQKLLCRLNGESKPTAQSKRDGRYIVKLGGKEVGGYEAIHGADYEGYLKAGWVEHLALLIKRAVDANLISEPFLPYFPDRSLWNIKETK